MFFVLSKVLGFFTQPSNLLIVLGLIGVALLPTRLAAAGKRLLAASLILLGICAFSPLGTLLTFLLEERFPRWNALGTAPDGIVVLGGGMDSPVSESRGDTALGEGAERMTATVELALKYPTARVVFSGGLGHVLLGNATEAEHAKRLFVGLGIPAGRIELEDRSRNTAENASFTKALVNPRPDERWLLVTSAAHMPRAIGTFRKVGFAVEANPVDWRTRGAADLVIPFGNASYGLHMMDTAVREWVGLIAYWLTGRIPEFFPGPRSGRECDRVGAADGCRP